jgi:mRNA-degrading endonuclease RelE of RelBE toxin-antitoxin system
VYFIETPIFFRGRHALIPDDDEFRALQSALAVDPLRGDLIRGTGGLRKIRWRRVGSGKRGGLRIIYYWHPQREAFLLLYVYTKAALDDLSATQRRLLSNIVEEEFQ